MNATEITTESKLKVPNLTAMAEYEDDIVVSGITGTKTLSGGAARLSSEILDASDGETPLREVVPAIGDAATAVAIAEALYEDGILYPVELLDPFDVDEGHRSLLESLLLGLDVTQRPAFASRVQETTIGLYGDPTVAEALREPLEAIGCSLDDPDPDVMVFVETESTRDRREVNRDWLDSEATLVRARLRGSTVEIGPLLTPSSDACLECLTTRAELNDAHQRLDYRSIVSASTYETAFCGHVLTRLALQAGLDRIPPELVGEIRRFDCRTFEHTSARLLGVPGCEACDAND
ncbi:hypothetical protein [Haloarcula salinisoli]|uniref:Bacteriocin biosynthesis cyclodehydratase domain-containing protein n=1 Tax=Haloarcula salinisoli TaxID=2487746 RepID=A0A8J7YBV6_9EURY|nr:hypothetical protein [Halomicroarcula salinisoli]MBX0302702.1 hypothetical protein [Halomicroarcula salinisoli]